MHMEESIRVQRREDVGGGRKASWRRRNPTRALKDSETLRRCRRGERLKAANGYGAGATARMSDPI